MHECTRRNSPLLAAALISGFALALPALADTTSITLSNATKGTSVTPLSMWFPITRSGDLSYETVLSYHAIDGTALAGTHFAPAPLGSSIVIPASAANASIPVVLGADTSSTPSLQFQLQVDHAIGIGPAPNFGIAHEFNTGGAPYGVAAADVNGDGKLDAIVANSGDNTVSILLNTTAPGATAPTYATHADVPAGSVPTSVTAADINGDAKADLIVTDAGSGNVAVLLNLSAPNANPAAFTIYLQFATGSTGSIPLATAVADFNGDGRVDIAVANYGNNTVSVLLNTTPPGALAPSFAGQVTFASGSLPSTLAARDLNGDGRPDLVVGNNGDATISVLFNTTAAGANTPAFQAQTAFAVGTSPTSVNTADINGDGRPDVIVANSADSTASVLLNQTLPGAATPAFAASQTFPSGANPSAITTSDVNDDEMPDLIVANAGNNPGENSISVLRNTTAPGASVAGFSPKTDFAAGIGPGLAAVAFADVNGDGRPDVLRASSSGGLSTLSVLLDASPVGTPQANFAAQQTVAPGVNLYPVSVVAADMNGDGKIDVVSADAGDGIFSVMLNATATGSAVLSYNVQNINTASGNFGIAVGDINGDGKPDVVIENVGGGITVHLNTTATGSATMSFATEQLFAALAHATEANGPPRLADLNGDGKLDIVFANGHSGFNGGGSDTTLVNTTPAGSLVPSFAAYQQFAAGLVVLDASFADINGDGKPDLLSVDAANLGVQLNTTASGSNTLSFAPLVQFGSGSGAGYVAAADVNGDGRIDAIVSNKYAGTVSVILNTTAPGATTPTFAAAQPFPLSDGPFALAMADVNGDGKPDIVVTNYQNLYNDASVAVLLNTTAPGSATANFAAQQVYGTGQKPPSVAVADANGDGHPDIIVGSSMGNLGSAVSVLVNTQYQASIAGSPATGTVIHDYLFANGFN